MPVATMYISELLGTLMLVFLGDSVVANVVLKGTKGNGSGWPVITLGWMVAVAVPVMVFGWMGGAHFNPAVTIGLAATGAFDWALAPGYIAAQMVGGFLGACLTFIFYYQHFEATEDKGTKLAVFCTGPAIRNNTHNFISEFIATFVLVFCIIGALVAAPASDTMGGGLGIAWIILSLGTALGGTTGYALNPARCLAPRFAHFILPVPGKGGSNWDYAWISTVGPLVGGILAGFVGLALFMPFA
jgi:glycerol uptake facilitator protein